MTWDVVRDQIASIVEAVEPASTMRGKPARFKHDTRASRSVLGGDRTFFFRALSGAIDAPYTPAYTQMRQSLVVELVVRYKSDVESEALDALIVADHLHISSTVLDAAQWSQSTTGIIRIGDGTRALTPYNIEDVTGARLLVISLPILFYTSVPTW